ncbi:MAG TPA: DNA-directed RNA polymerase subunit omega [Phycisphaerales bacterium]|nr:DNA-directed RNA polymerase subunit omega [Phycisphaerales bacterium]HMP38091.1 DNA-directed RNA polymerase subunit omega [Phycisphaerales bacterium]
MIEALKSDEIVNKVGGRFKLTALIQRRLAQIIDGERPLVERHGRTDFEVVIDEIMQDKIAIDYEASGIPSPRSDRRGARPR